MSESPENKAAWRVAYDYYMYCLTTTMAPGVKPLDVYKARMKKIQEQIGDELTVDLMIAVYEYFEKKERDEESEKPKQD